MQPKWHCSFQSFLKTLRDFAVVLHLNVDVLFLQTHVDHLKHYSHRPNSIIKLQIQNILALYSLQGNVTFQYLRI